MSKPILITGATGTIGGEVVKRLSEKCAAVRAAVRDPAKGIKQFGEKIQLRTFDFENPSSFANALEGVEKVFILPPLIPNQVEVTNTFVDAAKRAGVDHMVKLSAIGVEDEPEFTVGKWHAAGERHIRESGLDFTFWRP